MFNYESITNNLNYINNDVLIGFTDGISAFRGGISQYSSTASNNVNPFQIFNSFGNTG